MRERFTWDSPSSQLVLSAALDALVEFGYAGLTAVEIRARTGSAGALIEDSDLDDIITVALQRVQIFRAPQPTGSLGTDLKALLRPWRMHQGRDERAIAAVLSAAEWNPRLKYAVMQAFDRPLAQTLGTLLARATPRTCVSPQRVQTLNWLLRGLALERLRAPHPRSPVDLDELVDYLLAGLNHA